MFSIVGKKGDHIHSETAMDDEQFRQLLDRFNLSWDGYRKVREGVKKRLRRHMQKSGCRNVQEYLQALERNPQLRNECKQLLTVSISRFFRDRRLWEVLETDILPAIFNSAREEIRVWSAGCALGQEVYTFKILWQKLEESKGNGPRLRLWATDVNPDYIRRAQEGIYSPSALKEVPERFLRTHFRRPKGKKSFLVNPILKQGVIWEIRDLLSPPPGSGFDLVFLRNNLFTYYSPELKRPAFANIAESIRRGGYVIIGSHEALPADFEDSFTKRYHPCILEKETFA